MLRSARLLHRCRHVSIEYVLVVLAFLFAVQSALAESTHTSSQSIQPDEQVTIELKRGDVTHAIKVDCFLPKTPAIGVNGESPRHAALLLLHGSEGAEIIKQTHYERAAALRDRGLAVFYVHYFSGMKYDHLLAFDLRGRFDRSLAEKALQTDTGHWVQSNLAVLRWMAKRGDIDQQRIGVMGFSLGCFVAISTAEQALTQQDAPRVQAIVGHWGAMREGTKLEAGFPPVRLFHGEADRVVAVKHAFDTCAAMRLAGVDAEVKAYPKQEHCLTGDAAQDSFGLSVEFLRSKLVVR